MSTPEEFTPEQYARALTLLGSLKGLPGFPPDVASLRGTARSFLRIVRDTALKYYTSDDREVVVANDAEWLVEQIRDTCEFFPKPINMRRLYERRFKPADGRSSEFMENGG